MSQRFRKRRKFEAMLKSGLNKVKLQGIITEFVKLRLHTHCD